MVTQAFRYELDPTVRQRRLLARSAGTARYAFNWGLALCKARLEAKQPVPSAAALHRRWNAEKPQRSRVYGVSKCWHCATWTAPSRTSGEDARGAARRLPALSPEARTAGLVPAHRGNPDSSSVGSPAAHRLRPDQGAHHQIPWPHSLGGREPGGGPLARVGRGRGRAAKPGTGGGRCRWR